MGFSCDLENVFHFTYKAKLDNELIEHELDHVFIGQYDKNPKINICEVAEWKYMPIDEIQQSMKLYPMHYTAWFKICFAKVLKYIQQDESTTLSGQILNM